MFRIGIDARFINSSTGRYAERLLEHLQAIDAVNSYFVFVPERSLNTWQPSAKNFTLVVADYHAYSIGEQVGFLRLIKSFDLDLVHFAMPQQPIAYRGKHVTTFHDLTLLKNSDYGKNKLRFWFKQRVANVAFRSATRSSARLIANSKYTVGDCVKILHADPGKFKVTYLAADTLHDEATKVKQEFGEYLLYVGQQSGYKNVRKLAEAHQTLLEKHPDLGLVLVGRSDQSVEKNRALFERRGYRNIHFAGFMEDSALSAAYAGASVYVFPSLMEGFGLPGLEAMLAGIPVVSSDATCLPEIYGDAAIYFDATSVSDMATKIGLMLDNPALAESQIARGFRRAAEFSWARMAQETHDIYLEVLSPNR